jgi:hypothetical protein
MFEGFLSFNHSNEEKIAAEKHGKISTQTLILEVNPRMKLALHTHENFSLLLFQLSI